ncbi:MAG: glycosyltransferase [Gemmatimonadota bacterium]
MIYICIPAHNEERTIGVLLWKIRQVLADFPRDYQILVANDGSSDDTSEVLGPYQRVLPLTVVRIEKQLGYANALELLVREAVRRAEYPKRDVIVTLQADFTDDPAELTPMLKRIEAGADVVCTNINIPDTAPRSVRWARRIGKYLLRRRGWPEGVTDPLSGLRVYRVMAVKRAIEARGPQRLLTWDGWAANAELLKLVQPHARRTEVVDTVWRGARLQRPSRLTFWPLMGLLNRFARGGLGPLANVPLEMPVAAPDPRQQRGPRGHQARRESSRPEPAREHRGRPRRDDGDRGPRSERTPRSPRREQTERTNRPERPVRAERPARPPRTRPNREPAAAPESVAETTETVVAARVLDGTTQTPLAPRKKKRRRRRRSEGAKPANGNTAETLPVADSLAETVAETPVTSDVEPAESNGAPRKRRSRRGGRGRRGRKSNARNTEAPTDNNGVGDTFAAPQVSAEAPSTIAPETGSTS